MLLILQKEYDALHRKGGKPPKLAVKNKLDITLKYLREYQTMTVSRQNTAFAEARSVCLFNGWKIH
jgi:hypothetical protein